MSTQRVEGHTPTPYKYYNNGKGRDRIEDANGDIVCEQIGHLDGPFIVHACNNIERLEKVNEALANFVASYLGTCQFYGVPEHHKELHSGAAALYKLAKEPT